MRAAIGPDDDEIYTSPRPDILRQLTSLEPVASGTHVLLDAVGIRSVQRLALGDIAGAPWVAIWPAELKEQALCLYGKTLARPMLAAALELGWTAAAAPQLAFRNSSPALRLYLKSGHRGA